MRNKCLLLSVLIFTSILIHSCSTSNVSSAVNKEALSMKIKEQPDVINPDRLPSQQPLTMGERALAAKGQSRGLLSPVAGSLVSMATDAVKTIIANKQKKYMADYQFGLTDLYFYDQLSNESAFDPAGMQFSGFKISRTFVNNSGNIDTALTADFVVDTSRISEMINNSIFRLKVKDFQLKHAKAKVENGNDRKLNLDFEITFMTSYVNDEGRLFDSVVLGKFYLFLRDAPLDEQEARYKPYYDSLKDTMLLGKSFIVPRSFGYHRELSGELKPGYSQGSYSIQVKVKESSKNHFVTKMIFENANMVLDAGSGQLKTVISKKL
ncbi:MAG: hypothetical protein QM764_03800 [Chitinophagaceae bacterium]